MNITHEFKELINNMITIKITELGNDKIGFYVFNESMQLLSHLNKRKPRTDKKKYQEKLRKLFMSQGKSVFCDDQTTL